MDHKYYKDRLSGFHDLGLPLEEMELLKRHVESCPECTKELEEYKKLDELVDRESGLAGSDDYWESLATKIESKLGSEKSEAVIEEIPKSPYKGLGWKITAVAASFALIAFIAVYESDILESVDQKMEERARGRQDSDLKIEKDGLKRIPAEKRTITHDSSLKVDDQATKTLPEIFKARKKPNEIILETELPVDEPDFKETIQADEAEVKLSEAGNLTKEFPAIVDTVANKPSSEEKAQVKKLDQRMEPVAIEGEREVFKSQSFKPRAAAVPKVDKSQKIAFEPLALPEADETVITEAIDDFVKIDSLSYWRSIRDSLLDKSEFSLFFDEVKTSSRSKDKTEKSGALFKSLTSTSAEIQPTKIDSLTLESVYQVGRLTKNEQEKEQSIEFLRQHLESKQGSNLELARSYLEKLTK